MSPLVGEKPTQNLTLLINWSHYGNEEEWKAFFDKLLSEAQPDGPQYDLIAPFPFIANLANQYQKPGIYFGLDRLPGLSKESFTAPVALRMLQEAGIKFALVGNAEAKGLHPESTVKLPQVIKELILRDIMPFVCIGESFEEYQKGESREVLIAQLAEALKDLTPHQLLNISLVYEAPWIEKAPHCPTLEELTLSYRLCREVIQEHLGAHLLLGIRFICAVPEDFEDWPSLFGSDFVQGWYFAKGTLHQDRLTKLLSLSKDYEGEAPLTQNP